MADQSFDLDSAQTRSYHYYTDNSQTATNALSLIIQIKNIDLYKMAFECRMLDINRIKEILLSDSKISEIFYALTSHSDIQFFEYFFEILTDNGEHEFIIHTIRQIIIHSSIEGLWSNEEVVIKWILDVSFDWTDKANIILLTKLPHNSFRDIVNQYNIYIDFDTLLKITFKSSNPYVIEYCWDEILTDHNIEHKIQLTEKIIVTYANGKNKDNFLSNEWLNLFVRFFSEIISEVDCAQYQLVIDKIIFYSAFTIFYHEKSYHTQIVDKLLEQNYRIHSAACSDLNTFVISVSPLQKLFDDTSVERSMYFDNKCINERWQTILDEINKLE